MRTAFLTIAAAASAAAFAAPASAQYYYPQPQGYGYGNAYAYQDRGAAQRLNARAENFRRQVYNMHRRQMLTPAQAHSLDRQTVLIKRQIWRAGRNGLSNRELRSLDRQMTQVERKLRIQLTRNSRNNHRYGQRYAYGYRY